jgi:GT2 family glycosyltransferase
VEADQQLAPSVVAVMVVHEPGDWFDETLKSLADQDYNNLRTLFLVTPMGDDDAFATMTARIRNVLPAAFVRQAPSNDGFGVAANEVLRLVEGDNGFFLICHDDVALGPHTVRTLVAELFRSNAGIIGPKLTEWYQPRVLQHVGRGLDRFGEFEEFVEPGEVDQEQHDAVRDVFVVPSACMLVRADLFRALGGFDPAISFHGEDAELCWRAHLNGARVIVAPDASARHRELLTERRSDLSHQRLQSRHRMRAVATLTGGSRLLGRSLQLVILTVAELIVGLFTGRVGEALSSLRALVGLIPRTPRLIARRREILGQRAVPEREVLGLQNRGSSRLTSYLRGRETATFVGADTTVRRWRQASFGPLLAWFLVIVAIVVGSRQWIRDGVPAVGELVPFPSAGDLWSGYRSSFDPRGFGATVPNPTGWAAAAVLSGVALFRMPLFMTVVALGLFLFGAMGAWRLCTVFPVNRARIAGMVVYAGTPLVPGLYQTGDLSALVWFAALPWLVHEIRLAAGLATADPEAISVDLPDGIAAMHWRARLRSVAAATVVLAVAASIVPVTLAMWIVCGLLLALATVIAGSSLRVAAWLAGATVVSAGAAFLLNLPWALGWTWTELAGGRGPGSDGRPLAELASLAPNGDRFAVLALGLYIPVLAAVAIARAWRFTWGVRGALLVLVFGAGMVLSSRGTLSLPLPSSAILAVPVALGLALSAAALAGGFGSDVLSRGFGWRQPVALVANAAMVVGLAPAVLSIGDGGWHVDSTPLARLASTQFRADPVAGDYRVLYVGDPRVLPVPGHEFAAGIGYAVTDSGDLDFTHRFSTDSTPADEAVERAIGLIADGSTLRAGRLLAPLGIRFVVVPLTDGARSTVRHPIEAPFGIVEALRAQLDLGDYQGHPSLEMFINRAWFPVGAQLTGATADASRQAGDDVLVRADLSGAVPSMVGIDRGTSVPYEVLPGVVHVAIPFDDRFTLGVDDEVLQSRTGFGLTTAFDISEPGVGQIAYEQDPDRSWWLAVQAVLWLVVLVLASGARYPFSRRRTANVIDETLIDLDEQLGDSTRVAGEALSSGGWADDFDDDWLSGDPDAPSVADATEGDR